MQNPVQPAVEFVFDNKMLASLAPNVRKAMGDTTTFELFFDFETIANAEVELKRPLLMGLTSEELERPTIAFVRTMLYQSMRTHHPGITYDEAAPLVTAKTVRPLWDAVLTAFANAIRDDEEVAGTADPTTDQS